MMKFDEFNLYSYQKLAAVSNLVLAISQIPQLLRPNTSKILF